MDGKSGGLESHCHLAIELDNMWREKERQKDREKERETGRGLSPLNQPEGYSLSHVEVLVCQEGVLLELAL